MKRSLYVIATIIILLLIIQNVQAQEIERARFQVEQRIENVKTQFSLTYNLERKLVNQQYRLNEEHTFYIPDFHVKGIYVTGWAAGSRKMDDLIELVENTVVNSMVIDIKDQDGYLSYISNIPLASEIGANKQKIRNIHALIERLNSKGIYTIARIAVFKDQLLASSKEEYALQLISRETGDTRLSTNWVDPSLKEVWDYNILLARGAVNMGFDEIQFDYIRYPALGDGDIQSIVPDGNEKTIYINSFLEYARKEMAELNIPISIDVYGLTTTVEGDLGIGQDFTQLSNVVNIISPMIYPSHYSTGMYGIAMPEAEPSKVITRSLIDAQKKVAGNENVNIRPWLQDFSLRHRYTQKEVLEQIRAVEELGIKEWLLWSPGSNYTEEALNKSHFK
ncbi:MAG: putative glycoside hydrolase [Halanaerobiales bacterium]